MTVQLDSPQGNPAAQQSSVWNQPQQEPLAIFNPAAEGPNEVATVDQRHVDANGRRELATEIDGNASNTGTREQTLWYYRQVVIALGTGWSHPLLDELRIEVDGLAADLASGRG